MDYRQIFIDQYKEHITRRGSDRLLEWLVSSDFFTAPASTRFHSAYEGGLVEHSLNVYKIFMKKHFVEGEDDPESVAIATLLHDICKAGFYEVSYRNRKNDAGVWEKVPYYTINDRFPYGHGEKSVFLIERFMRLKSEEAVAIRWHMGGFDDTAKAGSFAIAHAYEQYPLAVKVHLSDLEATYLCESRNEED
ncbi:MAG: HD domain-containing protein [Clostridia bacterium]|nr:HD domain-containing protein [Clostridia bacterium]